MHFNPSILIAVHFFIFTKQLSKLYANATRKKLLAVDGTRKAGFDATTCGFVAFKNGWVILQTK